MGEDGSFQPWTMRNVAAGSTTRRVGTPKPVQAFATRLYLADEFSSAPTRAVSGTVPRGGAQRSKAQRRSPPSSRRAQEMFDLVFRRTQIVQLPIDIAPTMGHELPSKGAVVGQVHARDEMAACEHAGRAGSGRGQYFSFAATHRSRSAVMPEMRAAGVDVVSGSATAKPR